MSKHNPVNERIKRRYFAFLREAKRQSTASVDSAAEALHRFEESTRYRDFRAFHIEQAIAFKALLARSRNARTGEPLSKATICSTLAHLKRFFSWLAGEPGYRSKLKYSDAEYFNPSEKDARVASARRERPFPTVEQVRHVLATMPDVSDVDRRNRALIAFTLLTGARDGAIASFKLKHVDLREGYVFQDAREVRTKFSKSFTTYFFPVGDDVRKLFEQWVLYLRRHKLWGNDDPLFPATATRLGVTGQFQSTGLARAHWATATPIRAIFKSAFIDAGLEYFNPHSFRKSLVAFGQERCRTPEQYKAWSQNLGHDGVLTTLVSYGNIDVRRQGQLVTEIGAAERIPDHDVERILEVVARSLRADSPAPAARVSSASQSG